MSPVAEVEVMSPVVEVEVMSPVAEVEAMALDVVAVATLVAVALTVDSSASPHEDYVENVAVVVR